MSQAQAAVSARQSPSATAPTGCTSYAQPRSKDKGEQTAESIRVNDGDAVFYQADCSNPDAIRDLIDFTMERYGRLDGIVSNAGIGMGGTPLHEFSMDDYEAIFDLNLKGVFAGMKYGAEAIFKSGSKGGFLINVASIVGLMPQRGQSLYTATKFGVVGMTRLAALDYAQYNVTVNAICPGYTQTSMFDGIGIPEQAMDFFLNDCPSGRLGKPEECAYLALFLASDMARYITGAAIPVDGALSAGSKNIISWQHPEIVTGGKSQLNSDSTIAVLMESPVFAAIVEKHLPGLSKNEKAKAAYGITFKALCSTKMLNISKETADALFAELDALEK